MATNELTSAWSPALIDCGGPPPGDIATVIGAAAWWRLTDDIRRRFACSAAHTQNQTFAGVMTVVRASMAGRILAHVCRLIGTPLAPFTGSDVPVTVRVDPALKGRGVRWEREYAFATGQKVIVRSTKIVDPAGSRLLELVGGGFGMLLDVFEQDRALHFVSTRYFWQGLGARVYLPDLLSPGIAHVIHTDIGGGRFRFTIAITHPLLGLMFYQDGVFAEAGEVR